MKSFIDNRTIRDETAPTHFSLENNHATKIVFQNAPFVWQEFSFLNRANERHNWVFDQTIFNQRDKQAKQHFPVIIHENSITFQTDPSCQLVDALFQVTYSLFEDNSLTIKFDNLNDTGSDLASIFLKTGWRLASDWTKSLQIYSKPLELSQDDVGNPEKQLWAPALFDPKKQAAVILENNQTKATLQIFSNFDGLSWSLMALKQKKILSLTMQNRIIDGRSQDHGYWITYKIKS